MKQFRYKVIIPARGESKGLPKKNILPINGKALICYTIDAARGMFEDSDIVVSTDADEIKEVVEAYGLPVPGLRPPHLARDNTPTVDVLLDFLSKKFEDIPDFLILLQPTSPLRTAAHIREAIGLIHKEVDMVVSCTKSDANPYWNLFEENEEGYLIKSKKGNFARRQDVPPVYLYNGAIYIINTKSLLINKSLQFEKVVKYVMDKESSLDIDDLFDFKLAEYLINKI